MTRVLIVLLVSVCLPTFAWAGGALSSVTTDFDKACSTLSKGPEQVRTCKGPSGYEASIYQTPMGEQLTLANTAIKFSAAVIRCERGQKITKLVWRTLKGKPFAALVGYRCGLGVKGQSAQGAASRILVQGLKGFEEYGHEVSEKSASPTIEAAERLADSWLKEK